MQTSKIHVKPRDSLLINILVLRVFGVWFPEEEIPTWRTKSYYLFAVVQQGFWYYLYMLSEFINMIISFGDIEKMLWASFLLLTHVAQAFKNYYFYTNKKKMVRFLDELEEDLYLPKNEKQKGIIQKAMSRATQDSYILLGAAVVTCTLWAIFPFIEKTEEDFIRLPLSAWFPFDTRVSPYFEIFYTYQMSCVVINALTNISMDTIATGIFIQVSAQLDLLRDNLENMRQDAIEELRLQKYPESSESDLNWIMRDIENHYRDELEVEMTNVFVSCIKHHEAIINYAERIENIFNMCFLAQFSASVVIICATMFEISIVPTLFSIQFVSLVLYQFCIVFELLLFSWHGNQMMLKSIAVQDSVYKSEWYEFSAKFSRNILLIMGRSKRPIQVTAGKFFALSLSTFTGVLRLSWSYFAVLSSVHDEDKN